MTRGDGLQQEAGDGKGTERTRTLAENLSDLTLMQTQAGHEVSRLTEPWSQEP